MDDFDIREGSFEGVEGFGVVCSEVDSFDVVVGCYFFQSFCKTGCFISDIGITEVDADVGFVDWGFFLEFCEDGLVDFKVRPIPFAFGAGGSGPDCDFFFRVEGFSLDGMTEHTVECVSCFGEVSIFDFIDGVFFKFEVRGDDGVVIGVLEVVDCEEVGEFMLECAMGFAVDDEEAFIFVCVTASGVDAT